jgi:hypothetical protein
VAAFLSYFTCTVIAGLVVYFMYKQVEEWKGAGHSEKDCSPSLRESETQRELRPTNYNLSSFVLVCGVAHSAKPTSDPDRAGTITV